MSDIKNPFTVTTPENLSDGDIVSLFVPYPEYNALQSSDHQFLNGHRGSGKSMMLRMMTPGCQMITNECVIEQISYYGIYLSIKATELNTQEYIRLDNHPSGSLISEHLLCVKLLSALFKSLKLFNKNENLENLTSFYSENFRKILYFAGEEVSENIDVLSTDMFYDRMLNIFDEIQSSISKYIKRSAFTNDIVPYSGSLLGFLDTVIPIMEALKKFSIIKSKAIYFLLDDADNLSLTQTKVLNTWVSYRTTATVTLKISTQLNYKTKQTTSNQLIESPHDYSEIYFTSILTGSPKNNYPILVANVIEKRLRRYGIKNPDAKIFFPEDKHQEEEIQKIAAEFKSNWDKNGKGFRPGDDAYRYARPEYIRQLSQKKGAYRYLYAGFDQLVHMSSGIIRYFLDPAAKMFSEQQKINGLKPVTEISPLVQDQQMRDQANYLYINKFNELQEDFETKKMHDWTDDKLEKLHNIIFSLGMLFQSYVLGQTQSQRRTYSFFISEGSKPNKELISILRLGISLGYLDEGSIGNKSGFGRTPLYVLTRRIAPVFKLDPMGFSNNISLTSEQLVDMMNNPSSYKKRVKNKSSLLVDEDKDIQQDLNF